MLKDTLIKIRKNRDLSIFDLLSIDDLSQKDISLILELAEIFKTSKTEKTDILKSVTMINAFYEGSTRTRTSFEIAGKNLGSDVINVSGSSSSIKKGESWLDTTETFAAYHPKIIVIRSGESGMPNFLAKHVKPSIINAGDGWHEHPTQALLDLKTMLDYHKTLKGKVVTIVGDIFHSRVFGSLVRILEKYEATIRIVSPETFIPQEIHQFKVTIFTEIEKAIPDSDVIYALRVQEERGAKGYVPSLREYSKTFGISVKRFALAKPTTILMHPGPVIRDIDIHSQLMNHERSKILEQVENGLAIRKAIIWLLGDRYGKKEKPYKLI